MYVYIYIGGDTRKVVKALVFYGFESKLLWECLGTQGDYRQYQGIFNGVASAAQY